MGSRVVVVGGIAGLDERRDIERVPE